MSNNTELVSYILQKYPEGVPYRKETLEAILKLAKAIDDKDLTSIENAISDLESDTEALEKFYFLGQGNGWSLGTSYSLKSFSSNTDSNGIVFGGSGGVVISKVGYYSYSYDIFYTNSSGGTRTIDLRLSNDGAAQTTTQRQHVVANGDSINIKHTFFCLVASAGDVIGLEAKVDSGTVNLGTNNQHIIQKID